MAEEQSCCRVCGGAFFAQPLLHLSNMPASAQNFPDAASLTSDQGADLVLVQCQDCGLVQLTNPPVSYYRDVIRAAAFSEEMRGFRQQQFLQFSEAHDLAGKPVVEIGCGRGEFLSLIADAGMSAYGLEHLEASVQACNDDGLKVAQGYPDQALEIEGGPFAAFFIMNFFEHLPDLGRASVRRSS